MGEGTPGASQTSTAKAASPVTNRLVELRSEIERIAEASGCQLWHVELKGGALRVFLDKPDGGVNLSDCEHVSKLVSAYLDVVDFGKSRYVLEVSSPGLDRQLHQPDHFRQSVGRKVRVTFEDPQTGRKRTVAGRLEAFEKPVGESGESAPEEDARVVVIEEPKEERLELALRDIRQARWEIEL